MDQNLKQRLVGAIVITSLAAIFVPMFFDDPINETGKKISDLKVPNMPAYQKETEFEQLPQNIESVMNFPEPAIIKKFVGQNKSIPHKIRWFVQVGIFSQESNAISFQNKLRKQGFPVSITTISGEKETLYRVRMGPELNKKRAEAMKLKVDDLNSIEGIVTSVDE